MQLRFLFPVLMLPVALAAQSKKEIKTYKIKSTTVNVTPYDNGKAGTAYKESYTTFDKEGYTLEDVSYYSDGSVKRKESNKYDNTKDHNKTEEIVQKFDNPKKKNDDTDNSASSDSKYDKTTWKYNAKGDKTEEAYYDESGKLTGKTTYTYNNSGNKLLELEYNGNGVITRHIEYSYDGKGLRTEKKISDGKNVVLKVIKYSYGY